MTPTTPMKAIRLKCLDCCAGQVVEVRLCPLKKCPLHAYRMGHKPKEGNNPPDTSSTEKTPALPGFLAKDGHPSQQYTNTLNKLEVTDHD